jgi:hypothetical protein
MKRFLFAACLALANAAPAGAQPAEAGAPGDGGVIGPRGGEPQVRRIVSDDRSARVDELRVRGITRNVTVQSKLPGAPAYRIGNISDGSEAAEDRPAASRALWRLFSF